MPAERSTLGPYTPRRRPRAEDVTPGRVLTNLLVLGRTLREAGLPIGTGQQMSLVEALAAVDLRKRTDVYYAARATLVNRPEQIPIFDAEFARFWRRLTTDVDIPTEEFVIDGEPETGMLPDVRNPKQRRQQTPASGEPESQRTVLAIEGDESADPATEEEIEAAPEDIMLFSAREVLRKKDFAQFDPNELAEARRIIEGMDWRLTSRPTLRRERANLGQYIDYRGTLRRAMRHGGVPIDLRHRRRKKRMRPLILICDISGSMDRYTRLLLRFVHAMEHGLDAVEVFVFGTRLTRITRELKRRDVDAAIADVVNSVEDWSGGTRIGEAIKTFNYRWSRRVLRSGATVVVISDGWDRGEPELLGQEMARLQRSCRHLIWLNPLLGAPGYQPLTQGMRAALPFVDAFLPIHNLRSLESLATLLGNVSDAPPVRRRAPVPKRAA